MRVISFSALRRFWEDGHGDAREPLNEWMGLVSGVAVSWTGPADIKRTFGSASLVANNRVVFNIGGNKYRLIAEVNYKRKLIFVRFIGTHAEYDKVDAASVKRF